MLLTYIALTGLNFLTSFVQINPWYYVLAYIPFSIPGGMAVLGATIYAFISDVSNDQNRTIKMGIMKACIVAGTTLGSFSSRYILEWTSTTTVFVIATILILLGLTYIVLFVEDSIISSADGELGNSLDAIFSLSLVSDLTQAATRKRSRFVWRILWLIVGFSALVELGTGSNIVVQNYTHREFEWSRKQYSYFLLTESGLNIFANVCGIMLLRKVKHELIFPNNKQ